jgi:hypothetical protein
VGEDAESREQGDERGYLFFPSLSLFINQNHILFYLFFEVIGKTYRKFFNAKYANEQKRHTPFLGIFPPHRMLVVPE